MRYILFLSLVILSAPSIHADDSRALKDLLQDFLSGQTAAHHDRFWADELIYTSSAGLRFGKKEIMANVNNPADENTEASSTTFSGTDVDVRLYDDIAVVAFVLVAKESGEISQTYYNTGTFQKKSGQWQAIAWQATKIPKQE